MYQFKPQPLVAGGKSVNFNTSHVSVQVLLLQKTFIGVINFNTSHVSVQGRMSFGENLKYLNFNTSHVSVQDSHSPHL